MMQASRKFIFIAAAAFLCGAVVPSMAQEGIDSPQVPYDSYQGPHGRYGSASDLTRDVEGTPCGIDCTREARQRWSHFHAR